MGSGIYIALSGATAQLDALDVSANNIANASTPGFHAERVHFAEALTRAATPDYAMTRTDGTAVDMRPGRINDTGGKLDLAIADDGLFVVQAPAGERYTRAGNCRLDTARRLVTADGHPLLGTNGRPIVAPEAAGDLRLNEHGHLLADGEIVGQLAVARIPAKSLKREGDTLFSSSTPVQKGQKGPPGKLVAGALEQGNFDPIRGVVDLIRVSRTYEALHRMIETYKETDSRAARSLGSGGNG